MIGATSQKDDRFVTSCKFSQDLLDGSWIRGIGIWDPVMSVLEDALSWAEHNPGGERPKRGSEPGSQSIRD